MARLALVVLVSAVAGAVNSFAGGGTLLTFPALIGLGVPPIVANATSTVALWPASLGSMWGYRRELEGVGGWAVRFALPSFAGGLAGAILLLRTPASTFSALVPWLVLGATTLFIAQRPVVRWARGRQERRDASPAAAAPDAGALPDPAPAPEGPAQLQAPPMGLLVLQLGVAVYGGYFGAGIGILMLATLGLMGMTNIHRMNGLKNWGALCINAVAAATFAASGLVNWPVAACMAAGATVGGYAGAGLAQRFSQEWVRKAVAAVGLASGIWLAVERF